MPETITVTLTDEEAEYLRLEYPESHRGSWNSTGNAIHDKLAALTPGKDEPIKVGDSIQWKSRSSARWLPSVYEGFKCVAAYVYDDKVVTVDDDDGRVQEFFPKGSDFGIRFRKDQR